MQLCNFVAAAQPAVLNIPFSALRDGTTVRRCARTCRSRERRRGPDNQLCGTRAKLNLAVVGPDMMRRLVQSD
jgi:hypothetical protein